MLSPTHEYHPASSYFDLITNCLHGDTNNNTFQFEDKMYTPIQLLSNTKKDDVSRVIVFKCLQTETNKFVVFKIIKVDEPEIFEHNGETTNEWLEKYKLLFQANILSFTTHNLHDINEYIIISQFKGDSLRRIRKKLKDQEITMVALKTLHDQGFVHRDVKLDNIFMDGNMVVLGDLGCAKYLDDNFLDITIDPNELLHENTTSYRN